MVDQNQPYNPLDYQNLGDSVADALLERPVVQMVSLIPFTGAGVYAIYYTGDYLAYAPLAERNRDGKFTVPIYAGKAVPSGSRKGGRGLTGRSQALFRRLREHAESISQTKNLDLADFFCRYLVVEDIWIPLGESLIIERFQPVWNVVVDGFGNHDPGSGRHGGQRPMWDTIHPGRSWADRLQPNRREAGEILDLVERALIGEEVETLPEVAQLAED